MIRIYQKEQTEEKNAKEVISSLVKKNIRKGNKNRSNSSNARKNFKSKNNQNFNKQTWKLDILSKRIIAWISNLNLTLN